MSDTRTINELCINASNNIAKMQFGTIVTHEVIESMLNVKRGKDQVYYDRVSKLRFFLMKDHGIFLEQVTGTGYRISMPGDEIKLCEGRAIKGINQIHRATVETIYIKMDRITDTVKRARTIETAQKIASLNGMIRLGLSPSSRTAID